MATYIHDLPDWPKFRWDARTVWLLLSVHSQGTCRGALSARLEALGFNVHEETVLRTLTEDVFKSSEFEGEKLDANTGALLRRAPPRNRHRRSARPTDRHVEGVVEMMLDAIQHYDQPLTAGQDYSAGTRPCSPLAGTGMCRITVGDWRDDKTGAMQVVSGPLGGERVHYEAPPPSI